MKKLILETNNAPKSNYQLYGNIKKIENDNRYHIKFTSIWTGAKDPEAEQNKFEMFLTPDQLSTLKQLLESV